MPNCELQAKNDFFFRLRIIMQKSRYLLNSFPNPYDFSISSNRNKFIRD